MKRFIALTLVLMMVISLPAFVQAEDTASDTVSYTNVAELFNRDYEDATDAADAKSKNYTSFDDGLKIFEDGHGKAVRPTGSGAGTYALVGNNHAAFKGRDAIFHFEMDYYFTNNPGERLFLCRVKKERYEAIHLVVETDGKIRIGTADANDVMTYSANSAQLNIPGWNHFEVWIDASEGNQIATMKVNNSDVLTVAHTWTSAAQQLLPYASEASTVGIWLDNAKGEVLAKNYKVTSQILDAENNTVANTSEVPYKGSKIKLAFSETMNDETVIDTNFTLKTSGGENVAFTGVYNSEEKTYTVTPNELRPKTQYTITATGLKTAVGGYAHYTGDAPADPSTVSQSITFTTEKQPFAIGTVEDAGGNTYNVTVANTSGQACTGYIIAFNRESVTENGITYYRVTNIDIKPVSAAADGTTTPVAVTTGSADPEIHLMSDDGNFTLLDIWGE